MGTVTKTARAFDDNLEDFEVRIRVEPVREPENIDPADRPSVNSRIEIQTRGTVTYSDNPGRRSEQVVPWKKATAENFPGPRWGASDIQALKALLAKFHAQWKEDVDG